MIFARRVRRPKKRIFKSKLSVPAPRSAIKLKIALTQKIQSKEFNIGIKIAPKEQITTEIDKEGNLTETSKSIYSRKIPMKEIVQKENERLHKARVLRLTTDAEYQMMSNLDVQEQLKQYDIKVENPMEALEKLKLTERTRHWKMWHDHSSILNRSYVHFMMSYLYDTANFLTDEEYKEKNNNKTSVNVQSIVERPNLYIFGQSASTDADQYKYIKTRVEDIGTLKQPININGIQLYDEVRVFSGDNPARQFESGQQRGGNFSCLCGIEKKNHINIEACLKRPIASLDDRRALIQEGELWKKTKDGCKDPFKNLKKDEIIDELESRGINTDDMTKAQLQAELSIQLHGTVRPPALVEDLEKSMENINLQKYEVLFCEPLHDISNVVKNLIEELPYHMKDKQLQSEFLKFAEKSIGDKNQIRGSDARIYAVQLAKFSHNLYVSGKLEKEYVDLIFALVEVTKIAYSPYHSRSPRQLLRLYNQSFIFAILCRRIIQIPKKLTIGKFYGSHFHSMTTHLPQTHRIFSSRSILTEYEERCFGDLRHISETTTNRKPGYIVDNAVIRFNAQKESGDRIDSLQRQESTISQQSRLLPIRPDTFFPKQVIEVQASLFQAHISRISDFIACGENIWWHWINGGVVFHDSVFQADAHEEGPFLSHFRNKSLKQENEEVVVIWQNCLNKFKMGQLSLPLQKVKVNQNGKNKWIINKDAYNPCSGLTNDAEEANNDEQDEEQDEDISKLPEKHEHGLTDDNKEDNDEQDQDEDNSTLPEKHKHGLTDDNKEDNDEQDQDEDNSTLPEKHKHADVHRAFDDFELSNHDAPVTTDPVTDEDSHDIHQLGCTELPPENPLLKKVQVISATSPTRKIHVDNKRVSTKRTEPRKCTVKVHAAVKRKKVTQAKSSQNDKTKRTKRQLFPRNDNDSSDEDLDPFDVLKDIDGTCQIEQQNSDVIIPITERLSTTELVKELLGSSQDVSSFTKYRRLAFENPQDKHFNVAYEKAKAVIGFKLLAIYNKKPVPCKDVIHQQLKELLEHWGISTRY